MSLTFIDVPHTPYVVNCVSVLMHWLFFRHERK
jgi:hypothetical protein